MMVLGEGGVFLCTPIPPALTIRPTDRFPKIRNSSHLVQISRKDEQRFVYKISRIDEQRFVYAGKVTLKTEIGRFGLIVMVGGNLPRGSVFCLLESGNAYHCTAGYLSKQSMFVVTRVADF